MNAFFFAASIAGLSVGAKGSADRGGAVGRSCAASRGLGQAVPGSALWRRLELQGDTEHLMWLNRP